METAIVKKIKCPCTCCTEKNEIEYEDNKYTKYMCEKCGNRIRFIRRVKTDMETINFQEGGTMKIYRNYFKNKSVAIETDSLFKYLVDNMPWKKSNLVMYGRPLKTPRFQCWMADSDIKADVYSANRVDWDPKLLEVKAQLEELLDFKFNYLLLNYYETGVDYIGFHADNEVVEDTDLIASFSLGGSRMFRVRPKVFMVDGKNYPARADEKYGWELNDGDLVIMDGFMQRKYKHSVPKTSREAEPRINLTFRKA